MYMYTLQHHKNYFICRNFRTLRQACHHVGCKETVIQIDICVLTQVTKHQWISLSQITSVTHIFSLQQRYSNTFYFLTFVHTNELSIHKLLFIPFKIKSVVQIQWVFW